MKKNTLFVILLILTSFICNVNSQNIQRINIGKNINTKQSLNLSAIASSVEYIPLETTDDCLLAADILQIEFIDDEIFLCDGYYIYRFNKQGRFLKKIGKHGQGPGEYRQIITSFILNKNNKTITVFDNLGKRSFIVYTTDGDYVKEYKSEFTGGEKRYLTNDLYLVYNSSFHYTNTKGTYGHDLILMDDNGKIRHKYKYTMPEGRRYGVMIYPAIFYFFQGKMIYKNPFDEIIYSVNEKDKTPLYVFDLGRYDDLKDEEDFTITLDRNGTPIVKSNASAKERLAIYRLSETEQYLYIVYNKGNDSFRGVFDKSKLQFYNIYTDNTYGITDDINKGFHFWPILGIQHDTMIDYKRAHEFKELNPNKVEEKLRRVINDLDEEDNPVIILAKIKK
ncbi:6-bladed beta-propeller [Parabacteroides sp. OttesenSCG-928-G21]|nr:6-bladed beta-propeller [Parabacteroides sp. OttesenSCG-928-G21]